MSITWNLDLSVRSITYVLAIVFSVYNGSYGWIIIFFGLIYFWSELDEDEIGDDLEEYIEFFLDECGLHDKWANNVIESLERYENLIQYYSKTYSDSHTDTRNIYIKKDEDYLFDPIDYDHFRENKELFDKELEMFLTQYLQLGNEYEYKYRGLTSEQIKNLETAQNFYDSINNTFYIKYTNEDDVGVRKSYDYEDIDPDFGDYVYLYKLAEKYYDWFHTSNYPLLNNTIKDWEELYLEKLIDKYDKKSKGVIDTEQNYSISKFLIKKSICPFNLKTVYLNKRYELLMHPYPIYSKKEDVYHLIFRPFDRWRNSLDHHLVKELYFYVDLAVLEKILIHQKFIDDLIKNEYKL